MQPCMGEKNMKYVAASAWLVHVSAFRTTMCYTHHDVVMVHGLQMRQLQQEAVLQICHSHACVTIYSLELLLQFDDGMVLGSNLTALEQTKITQ